MFMGMNLTSDKWAHSFKETSCTEAAILSSDHFCSNLGPKAARGQDTQEYRRSILLTGYSPQPSEAGYQLSTQSEARKSILATDWLDSQQPLSKVSLILVHSVLIAN